MKVCVIFLIGHQLYIFGIQPMGKFNSKIAVSFAVMNNQLLNKGPVKHSSYPLVTNNSPINTFNSATCIVPGIIYTGLSVLAVEENI